MGASTSIFYNKNKKGKNSIKIKPKKLFSFHKNNNNDNVEIVNTDDININSTRSAVSRTNDKFSLIMKTSSRLNIRTDINIEEEEDGKDKLLDSFHMNTPTTLQSPRFFASPIEKDSTDTNLYDNFNENLILSKSNHNILDYDSSPPKNISPEHGIKLHKALSFRLPKNDRSIHKLSRKASSKDNKKLIVCDIVNEDDDDNYNVKTFVIESHNYNTDDVNNKNLKRFHSFSVSPTFSSAISQSLSNNTTKIKKHTCDLCSLTFDDEIKFINHTKYSKIHDVALMTYQSRLRRLSLNDTI